MNLKVYSIRDDVACFFGAPFVNQSDELAIRDFKFQISHSQGIEHDYSGDFTLMRVGSFDISTGAITAELPTIIFKGCEVVA